MHGFKAERSRFLNVPSTWSQSNSYKHTDTHTAGGGGGAEAGGQLSATALDAAFGRHCPFGTKDSINVNILEEQINQTLKHDKL